MGQVSKAVFSNFHLGVVVVSIVTGLILVLAANTAFNGFPVLGSILARDGFLPRQLHTRGDRLAFSNGILILAGAAAALVVVFNADVTRLIQLYIVGVFVSFTLSQTGMVRHWNRYLRVEKDPAGRARMLRSRVINAVGATMSGLVLVVVLATKFVHGAGYAIAAMAVLFFLMLGIRRHYDHVRDELSVEESDTKAQMLPSRVHAIVLVVEDPQADAARAGLRPGHPALGARGDHRLGRRRGDQEPAAGVGPPRHPGAAQGARQPLPRDHPPGRRVRQVDPHRQPARHRRRLHPAVRGRPLVGAAAAQPECPAAAHPPPVHARGHGLVACRGSSRPPRAWRSGWTAPSSATSAAASDGRAGGRGLAVGDEVEVEVTGFAHGGHCVARHEGQVLFVRHTLPGERVRARVTEVGGWSALRAGRRRRGAVGVPGPRRAAVPVEWSGGLRRVRPAARRPRRPAPAQGRGGPEQLRAAGGAGRRGRGRGGARGRRRPGLAHPRRVRRRPRRPGRPAPAPLARGACASTPAGSPRRA